MFWNTQENTSHCHCVCGFISVLQFAGERRACADAGRPRKPSVERGVQNLIQVSGGNKVQVRSDFGWKLLQVFLVTFRKNYALHSCPMSRQDLIFDTAHLWETDQSSCLKLCAVCLNLIVLCWVWLLTGSTSPLNVISPVMATSDLTNRLLNNEARQVTMVTPAEGPSLVTAPAGKWRWMSVPSNGSGPPTTVQTQTASMHSSEKRIQYIHAANDLHSTCKGMYCTV